MNDKVNIACVYWKGDFRARDFQPGDVWRLFHSMRRHAHRPFEFFVLTNDPTAELPGTVIELKHPEDWIGWWAKMELFRPGIFPKRRTFYQDLDSFIIRDLSPLFEYTGDLVMFTFPDIDKKKFVSRNPGISVPLYRNSTMLFNPWEFEWVYEKFLRDDDYYLSHYRGDQDIITEWLPNQPTFITRWLAKLGDMETHNQFRRRPPPEVLIITGQPRSGLFRNMKQYSWFKKMI